MSKDFLGDEMSKFEEWFWKGCAALLIVGILSTMVAFIKSSGSWKSIEIENKRMGRVLLLVDEVTNRRLDKLEAIPHHSLHFYRTRRERDRGRR